MKNVFKFFDNLTGLEDKSLKWNWSVGPQVGMVFGDPQGNRDYLITDIVYKNNGNIIIWISIKRDYHYEKAVGISPAILLELRRQELLSSRRKNDNQ